MIPINCKRVAGLLAVLLLVALGGCAPSRTNNLFSAGSWKPEPAKRIEVSTGTGRVITKAFTTNNCGSVSRGGFIWFTSAADFDHWVAAFDVAEAETVRARVPFDEKGALLVDFGSLPTPGYDIRLMENRLEFNRDKAIVKVDLVKPAGQTKKRVQMISHPCALFVMPRSGYRTLEVQTGLGDVLTVFANR